MEIAPAVVGLIVGVVVGLTSTGGGALLTPALVLVLGVPASAAIGSDVLIASVMKFFGGGFYALRREVHWPTVLRLAVGSKIVYASALEGPLLNSNVVLEVRPGNTAFGHCTIDLSATPNGVCTFSGGTGQFIHFQASVVVSHLGTVNYAWDGTYSFSPRD